MGIIGEMTPLASGLLGVSSQFILGHSGSSTTGMCSAIAAQTTLMDLLSFFTPSSTRCPAIVVVRCLPVFFVEGPSHWDKRQLFVQDIKQLLKQNLLASSTPCWHVILLP